MDSKQPAHFVDLEKYIPSIKLDIVYARTDNFLGQKFYEIQKAFLVKEAADALKLVQENISEHGLGLLVFDAYRPWSVTQQFWELAKKRDPNMLNYLADPQKGSVHNRGCAVDISFYNLVTGQEISMPSKFDEMNESAHTHYERQPRGGEQDQVFEQQKYYRDLLQNKMNEFGFRGIKNEWWHFNFVGLNLNSANSLLAYERYPIENFSLLELAEQVQQSLNP